MREEAPRSLRPWLEALQDPEEAQARVLESFLGFYAETDYGSRHGLEADMDLEEFRKAAPIRPYEGFRPYIREVLKGRVEALLAGWPEFFGITSGTTGPPKVIPIPSYDARLRAEAMSKCMAWYAHRYGFELAGSACIAPCLPSKVLELELEGRKVSFGYISGINAEIMARYMGLEPFLRPYLEEVNEIGPGTSKADWDRRFRALLSFLEGREVRIAVGAGPALWMFAKWLKRELGSFPRELWDLRLVLVAGVPHIRSSYARELTRMYGRRALLVEGYGATEGLFAISLEGPCLTPFYDRYLFEVRIGREVKMLYEMKAGEVGKLVVSTPVFPRYEIGDLVECLANGLCFTVPGRDSWPTRVRLGLRRVIEALASFF